MLISCFLEQRYRCKDELGKGSMGVVFIAEQNETNEKVAIKKIYKNKYALDEDIEKEIINVLSVKNDHIISILQFYFDHHQCCLWIVMPLCKSSLRSLINKQKQFTNLEIQSFIMQIVSAFQELDLHQIMHLDLKPENILIENQSKQSPRFILCDFGCSQQSNVAEFFNYQNNVFGTFQYLAPQNYLENQQEKLRSSADIWSFGVILYQMIFKKLPYCSIKKQQMTFNKLKHVYQRQLKKNIYNNGSTSKQILDLIYLMLNPIPSKRITWQQIKEYFISKMNFQTYQFTNINQILFLLNVVFKLFISFVQAVLDEMQNCKQSFWKHNRQLISKMLYSITIYAQNLGQKIIKKQGYRWKIAQTGQKTVFMNLFQKLLQRKNIIQSQMQNPQQQDLLQQLKLFRKIFSSYDLNSKSLIFINTFSHQLNIALSKGKDLLSNIFIFIESFKLIQA